MRKRVLDGIMGKDKGGIKENKIILKNAKKCSYRWNNVFQINKSENSKNN